MYYLKYRPQTIEEIDTKEIREKVVTLINTKSLPHAWLFTGPKGTGKTSTARIIAKSINCEDNFFANKSKSVEPCNKCKNCQSISLQTALDVYEIDAASNRKIDDIRSLIEQIKFAPAQMRYKVYIIDEVHMLTTESFNAILKTLEEPPKSTIFILATTETAKVPPTIQSRCLNLIFRKADRSDVLRMFDRILKGERKVVSNEILDVIADHCDNSFRDGAKILEEAVTHKVKNIPEIERLLGISKNIGDLVKHLINKDLSKSIQFIEDYDNKGGNIGVLIESLLDTLHRTLLAKNGIGISPYQDQFTVSDIARLMKLFTNALNLLKYSPVNSIPLEIAVIEFFEEKK